MKKIILSLAVIFAATSFSNAQNSLSIKPIMEEGLEFVKEIEKKYDGKAIITKAEFDFALDDNYTMMDLNNTLTYVFAGLGDENISDISLVVYKNENGSWVKVSEDSEVKPSAVVSYQPPSTGEYAVDIKVNKYKSADKIGHVALFVLATK
ncbi:hypothetical protein [Cytophaga hutchinsonii]|uniref:Uncharacterized protein n=1 Tax=Cytophaga hutchinsonii (strain ATCC 33406 / DSM 1761 / CIP 103989 / NBRC 15051 / NCIMB 9469 / D465) TaxID=269798 RepID=A0A6N4SWH8_CYTH3|nr:hypothetical protein [Cytophaga hutchinsonii]ABG60911.1 hypothetical protein CHU_3678 [Cytophaga hutchinsonii ATCC 33406]SFX42333.1 hypothetical protein SAMN04487930_10425 [Cytophaga hutchinsonii ATCC 33406]